MKRSHEQNQTLRVTSCSFVDRFCFPPIVQTYPVLDDATRVAYAADSGITVYGSKDHSFSFRSNQQHPRAGVHPEFGIQLTFLERCRPYLTHSPWFPKVVGKSNIDHPSSMHSSTLLDGPHRR
jgi:hypothetical protein